jgi:RNA polymerase sigma-70 factor (ECF subfamily)
MNDISQDILQRAGAGEMAAFEEVYRQTSGFVYNVALKITRNGTDAEEVTQDVFMKVYRNLKDFRFQSAFKTWLYRIAVNTAINRYRQSARQSKGRQDYEGIIDSLPGGVSPSLEAIEGDNKALLDRLLENLNPEYKACLLLREIEGLDYREIAAALRIPINTVRSRLKRARQALLEMAGRGVVKDAV